MNPMTHLHLHTLFSAAVLLSGLAAQDPAHRPAPPPAARADDLIVARLANPARLRSALLSTTVGDLLAGEGGLDFRDRFVATFEAVLGQLDPRASQLVLGLAAAMGEDTGTWTIGVQAGEGDRIAGSLELEVGRGTETAAIFARLQRLFDDPELPRDSLQLTGAEDGIGFVHIAGFGIANPRLVDDRIRIDWGRPFAEAYAARQEPGPAWTPPPTATMSPFLLEADVERLANQAAGGLESPARISYLRMLGIPSLESLRIHARANGPYLEFETALTFRDGVDRGLFAGLFPAATTPPALAGLVPEDATSWQALPFDSARSWKSLRDSLARWFVSGERGDDQAIADFREMEREFLGQNLDDGFFSHLAPQALFLGSLDTVGAGTFLAALPVKDRALAERSWGSLLSRIGPFLPGDEQEDVEHAEGLLHGTDELWYVFTDDLFVVSWGERPVDSITAVLDRRVALRNADAPLGELPATVRRRVQQAPPGFHGCGTVSTRELVGLEFAAEVLELPDVLQQLLGAGWTKALEDAGPQLAEHGVEHAVSLSGWDAESRTWRYRVLW